MHDKVEAYKLRSSSLQCCLLSLVTFRLLSSDIRLTSLLYTTPTNFERQNRLS